MSALTGEEMKLLGPLISPFEESKKSAAEMDLSGEIERDVCEAFIHDGRKNSKPKHLYIELTVAEIATLKANQRYPEKAFLWVIDETSIKIVREKIPNVARRQKPEYVCHTNLTGYGKAFAGGELFFGEDGSVYINPWSDRYGGNRLFVDQRWQTVLSHFRRVGYTELVDIVELMNSEP